MVVKLGGEGKDVSKADAQFLEAYTKIAGKGKSPQEQINQIQSSVQNKLVNDANNLGDQQESNRRELKGLDRFMADTQKFGEGLASGVGNLVFGEEVTEDPVSLPYAARTLLNLPGMIIGSPFVAAGNISEGLTHTDYEYYDPETGTVPDDEYGTHNTLGSLTSLAAGVVDAVPMLKGFGVGRVAAGAAKGAARGGANIATKKLRDEDAALGPAQKTKTAGESMKEGFTTGLSSKVGETRQKYEDFLSKSAPRRIGASVLEEAGQEVVQEGLEWIATNDDKVSSLEDNSEDWGDFGKTLQYAAVGGAIGGTVSGGMQSAVDRSTRKAAERKEEILSQASSMIEDFGPSRFDNANVGNFIQPNPRVDAAYKDAQRAEGKVSGQSTVVTSSDDIGLNHFDAGPVTLAAVYDTVEGQELIDSNLKAHAEELGIDLTKAILAPTLYEGGEDAATDDINKVLDKAGGIDGLIWKSPSHENTILMNLRRIRKGNGLWVNQALSKLFNGDFDTDMLGFTFDPEVTEGALTPTQRLASDAVGGKVNLDLDYTSFGFWSDKINKDLIVDALVETGMAKDSASKAFDWFKKQYNNAKNGEERAQVVAHFLSNQAKGIDPELAEAIFSDLQLRGDKVAKTISDADDAATVVLERSKLKVTNQTGSVPTQTPPVELQVRLGNIQGHRRGKTLRQAASWLFQIAKDQGVKFFTTSAAVEYALDANNIASLGEKPQEVLKKAYRDSVRAELKMRLLEVGGRFRSAEEFMDIFVNIVNRQRGPFEAAQEYTQLDGTHIFDEFVGKTDEIKKVAGALKAFEQICGEERFDSFFFCPDSWTGVSVSSVFAEIAGEPHSNAFAEYNTDEKNDEFEFLNAVKNVYKTQAKRIVEDIEAMSEEAVTKKLNPDEEGIVPDNEMDSLIARWNTVLEALHSRVVSLNLSSIAALDRDFPGFYEALISDDAETFVRMLGSLAATDECSDLMAAVKAYNESPSLKNKEMVEFAAARQAMLLSPPYRLVAAEIIAQIEEGEQHLASQTYHIITSLHETDIEREMLSDLLGGVYDRGDFGVSYGDILADLLVVSSDEISLGQLKEDIKRARVYSRRAVMTAEEIAEQQFQEIESASKLLGDSPLYFVSLVEDMISEAVLWSDEVMSEMYRSGYWFTNATKEKAKQEVFAGIVVAGRQAVRGSYTTQEDFMFGDNVWEISAKDLYSDPTVLRDYLFGPESVAYKVVADDGSFEIVTKADFFEKHTGKKFDPAANEDVQIFEVLKNNKKILVNLLPRTLKTTATEKVRAVRSGSAKDYYAKYRNQREERYLENKRIGHIKAQMQEDPEVVEYIFYLIADLAGDQLDPTNAHQFFEYFSRAQTIVARAIYQVCAVTSPENSAQMRGAAAKANSLKRGFEKLGDVLGRINAKRLATKENEDIIGEIMAQTVEDSELAEAADTIFGEDSAALFAPATYEFDVAEAEKNNKIAMKIDLLQSRAKTLALQRYLPESTSTTESLKSSLAANIMAAPESAIIQYAEKRGIPGTPESIRVHLISMLDSYTEEQHAARTRQSIKDVADQLRDNRLPDSLDRAPNDAKSLKEAMKGLNPTVDEITGARVYDEIVKLKTERLEARSALNDRVVAKEALINDKRKRQKKKAYKEIKQLRFDYNASPKEFLELYGSLEAAIAEVNDEIDRLFDSEIMTMRAAQEETYKNVLATTEQRYKELVDFRDRFEFFDLMTSLQAIGDPLNPESISDLISANDRFLALAERYRDTWPTDEDLPPLLDREPGRENEIDLPNFSTLESSVKVAAANVQVAMLGGDVEVGTGAGADGSGRGSIFGQMGRNRTCDSGGTPMSPEEAITDPDVISIRVVTPNGDRIIEIDSADKRLKAMMGNKDFSVDRVIAYKKNECTCPGCCANHDLMPVYNQSTDNNTLSTFIGALSYYMEEVLQLQKKKNLSAASVSSLFDVRSPSPGLTFRETDAQDIAQVMENCEEYTKALADEFHSQIEIDMNQMSDDVQKQLADPDIFARKLADFCTRFVLIQVHLSDGKVMSEMHLKNSGLEERIAELAGMEGVDGAGVIPICTSLKESENAAIRFSNDMGGSDSDLFMAGLQDSGSLISQKEDGTFFYTDSVTFKPGQIAFEEYYGLSDVLRRGGQTLPPGPGTKSPWLAYIEALLGRKDFLDQKGRRSWAPPKNTPSSVNSEDYSKLKRLASEITGRPGYVLVNADVSDMTNDSQRDLASRMFSPTLKSGKIVQFGLNADPIAVEEISQIDQLTGEVTGTEGEDIAMAYIATPTREKINSYCKWAEQIPHATEIFISANGYDAVADSDYGYTKMVNGYYVIEIDPLSKMHDNASNGFTAQTIEMENDWLIVVGSERRDIGDGILLLPTEFKGTQSTVVREGQLDLTEPMKDRLVGARIVRGEEQSAVIEAYKNHPAEPGKPTILYPETWDNKNEDSVSYSFREYDEATLSNDGIAVGRTEKSIVAVVALPARAGDTSGVVTYYPVTMKDLGLGSIADEITVTPSADGAGYNFYAFKEITWDEDTVRKYIGGLDSAAKATIQLSSKKLTTAANGVECAELKMSDLVKKTTETTTSFLKKFVAAYQTKMKSGAYRSLWLTLDNDGNPIVREGLNPFLTGNPAWNDAISSYENRVIFDLIRQGHTYKDENSESFDANAENALRKFLDNCAKLGASPNKLLSPMIVRNGKPEYKTFGDAVIDLYFTGMTEEEIFSMFSYITDGEFCPPDTMTLDGDYFINYKYEMRMENGEYRFFSVDDRSFNSENISTIDPSSDGTTYGLQASARRSNYLRPAPADYRALAIKQNLDAREYDQFKKTNEQRIRDLQKRKDSRQPAPPPLVGQAATIASAFRAEVGKASRNSFWTNMDDAWKSISDSYRKPARITRLDSNGVPQDIGDEDWRVLKKLFNNGVGLSGDKAWGTNRIQRFISNLLSYTSQDTGIDFFDYTDAERAISVYVEKLDSANKGVFPRESVMLRSEKDPSSDRLGTCGTRAMLQEEWALPKVRALFDYAENGYKEFLTAAGKFQRKQSTLYREALASSNQKLKMYWYYQLYLQADLNNYVPGGVGAIEPFDIDGKADETANEIMKIFGYGTGDEAFHEAMSQSASEAFSREMNQQKYDKGAWARRKAAKKDKDGNTIPPRVGRTQESSAVGRLFNAIYSLRVANALALNLGLTVANTAQIMANGQAQSLANKITFLTNGAFKNGIGVQPRDFDVIHEASGDSQLLLFFKLNQMTAWYDDPSLLTGFFDDPDQTMAKVNQTLRSGSKPEQWIRRYARLSTQIASGNGLGMRKVVKNYLFRFGQYLGDPEWLTEHVLVEGQRVQAEGPIMTVEEWEGILSDGRLLQEFMAKITDPNHRYNVIHRAAMEDSLRITWARKNIVTELLSSILTSVGNSSRIPLTKDSAEGLIAVGISPFIKYLTNFAMFASTAIYGLPSESILHIAHHRGLDLKQWMLNNGVQGDVITRIDFEAMSSSRSLKEALIRDIIKFGGFQLLGLVAAGLLGIEPPEDDDLKDNWEEYTIRPFGIDLTDENGEPFRLRLRWPLQDILGPFGPATVYWSTVMAGKPNPNILAEGFADLIANSATMTVENFFSFMSDPLLWTRDTSDNDMGVMNGANTDETDPAIINSEKFYMQGVMAVYRVLVPNTLDQVLGNGLPGTQKDVSSNYILELDDSGRPTGRQNTDTGDYYLERTDAVDAAWRRLTKQHTLLGYYANLTNLGSLTAPEGQTGYLRSEMPNIVRYNPWQIESSKIYEINGEVEHDEQVAADVITMLASYDDLDELMSTGFYVNAETRFYVGQKVWDMYYSYKDQIDQAKAMGLKDFKALGNGDYNAGQVIWENWEQSMDAQAQFYYDFYYDKLNSSQLRTRMETANVIRQTYDMDANGEWYGTGFYNDNPWAFFSIGSRFGNAGQAGGWSSIDPLTKLPVGERGWIWNKANSYYDSLDFKTYSERGDGKGYSTAAATSPPQTLSDLASLADLYNPNMSGSSYGRSGGGGGGGGGMSKLYSNPQDLNADNPTIMRPDRLYDSTLDYIRPDWETKGSREASRRSDI